MATFLELCQRVARESGTVSDLSAPATTTGQTGRLLRIVNWTNTAYGDIQRSREDWRWMRQEWSGGTLPSVQRYNASALGIASRFGHWIYQADDGAPVFFSYRTADGAADEGGLAFHPWDHFRRRFMVAAAASETGRPAYVTIDPQDRIVLFPTPDAPYTLRGEYYRAPQALAADSDIPEMPAAYHDAIVWRALILMGVFDEAMEQASAWSQFYRDQMAALVRTQVPRLEWGAPLA